MHRMQLAIGHLKRALSEPASPEDLRAALTRAHSCNVVGAEVLLCGALLAEIEKLEHLVSEVKMQKQSSPTLLLGCNDDCPCCA